MENTGRFELPLIMPSQAQKHVTHNEALTLLDGLIHLVIAAAGLLSPPLGAALDDVFVVGSPASGAWFGQSGKLALNTAAGWRFSAPVKGTIALFAADNAVRVFSGSAWTSIGDFLGELSVAELGVNTSPDGGNRMAVRSNAALFTALETASGGTGDMQIKLNKEAAADTASLLFQTGYSGRAEIGLAGDDNLTLKVSADGAAWQTAAVINKSTGQMTLSDNSIGNEALADMASARLKGRASAGTGDPQDLTGAQVTALLDVFSIASKGLAPASGGGASAFLRADGVWAAPSAGGAALFQKTLDFGAAPVSARTFTFTHAGASMGQKVIMSASAATPAPLSPDELEMDGLCAAASVSSADVITVCVNAIPGPVSGQRNFNYIIQ